MVRVMKYIRFLVMIGLCLNSGTMVAAEQWKYIPVPGFQEGQKITGDTSFAMKNIMSSILGYAADNPKLVLLQIAAGCLVLILYRMHQKNLWGSANNPLTQINDSVKSGVDSYINQLPGPVKASLYLAAKPLQVVVSFSCGSVKKYVTNNKRYMLGGGIPLVVGWASGFPIIGGMIGGVSFTVGFIQSVRQELQDFREENKASHGETHKKIDELSSQAEKNKEAVIAKIDTDIKVLSNQINEIQEQISEQVSALGERVNAKIDGVDSKVVGLSYQLEELKNGITDLASRFDTLQQNDDQRARELRQTIEKTNENLNLAQKKFNEMTDMVGKRVEESQKKVEEHLASTTVLFEQLMSRSDKAASEAKEQLNAINIEQTEQAKKNEQLQQTVNELLNKSDEHKNLLKVTEKCLEDLSKSITQAEQQNVDQSTLLNTIHKSQQESDVKTKDTLEGLKNVLKHSVQQIEDSTKTLFDKIENRVTLLETQVKQDRQDAQQNNQHLLEEIKNLRSQMLAMQEDQKRREELLHQTLSGLEQEQKGTKDGITQLNASFSATAADISNRLNDLGEQQRRGIKLLQGNEQQGRAGSQPNSVPFIPLDQRLKMIGNS
jgi:hypothetical protein